MSSGCDVNYVIRLYFAESFKVQAAFILTAPPPQYAVATIARLPLHG